MIVASLVVVVSETAKAKPGDADVPTLLVYKCGSTDAPRWVFKKTGDRVFQGSSLNGYDTQVYLTASSSIRQSFKDATVLSSSGELLAIGISGARGMKGIDSIDFRFMVSDYSHNAVPQDFLKSGIRIVLTDSTGASTTREYWISSWQAANDYATPPSNAISVFSKPKLNEWFDLSVRPNYDWQDIPWALAVSWRWELFTAANSIGGGDRFTVHFDDLIIGYRMTQISYVFKDSIRDDTDGFEADYGIYYKFEVPASTSFMFMTMNYSPWSNDLSENLGLDLNLWDSASRWLGGRDYPPRNGVSPIPGMVYSGPSADVEYCSGIPSSSGIWKTYVFLYDQRDPDSTGHANWYFGASYEIRIDVYLVNEVPLSQDTPQYRFSVPDNRYNHGGELPQDIYHSVDACVKWNVAKDCTFHASVWDDQGRRTGGFTSTDGTLRKDIPGSNMLPKIPSAVTIYPIVAPLPWFPDTYQWKMGGYHQYGTKSCGYLIAVTVDNLDHDIDGLEDWDELSSGTDSNNPDTDGDHLQDNRDSQPLNYNRRFAMIFEITQFSDPAKILTPGALGPANALGDLGFDYVYIYSDAVYDTNDITYTGAYSHDADSVVHDWEFSPAVEAFKGVTIDTPNTHPEPGTDIVVVILSSHGGLGIFGDWSLCTHYLTGGGLPQGTIKSTLDILKPALDLVFIGACYGAHAFSSWSSSDGLILQGDHDLSYGWAAWTALFGSGGSGIASGQSVEGSYPLALAAESDWTMADYLSDELYLT